MADPVHVIFGATLVETLHAFCKGSIGKVTFLDLKDVPARKKAAFDELAGSLLSLQVAPPNFAKPIPQPTLAMGLQI